ncbi:MAG TPA: iron-sulfur cluster assembly scaffold protein [Fimbriimonadaceae bacterium]|nr:iron-sulfur cluster assembly scaffold protein [Fimbriimonadaceae bacterium]
MLHPRALRHIEQPRNVGPDPLATHIGAGGSPGDGPYVQLWLRIEGEKILTAAYACNGCPSSTASASLLAELITGKDRSFATQIEREDILALLGGLPEGKDYYVDLALAALANALMTKEKENS